MKSLELIVNGVVVPTTLATNVAGELVFDQETRIDRAGWLAVRCSSENNSLTGGPALNAHGNPIYVEMPGHSLDARADAEYFLAWIDRLEADLKSRDRIPVGLDRVTTQLGAARAVYRRLAGVLRLDARQGNRTIVRSSASLAIDYLNSYATVLVKRQEQRLP
jgi:hypothetical protein